MSDLSVTELKVLNNISNEQNPAVDLGTLLQAVIDSVDAIGAPEASKAEEGTPVNAAAATGVINITGVSLHGETVTIGDEVYELNASDGTTPSDPAYTVVDITTYVVKASQVLTVDTQPTSGNTMTIGTKVYTFVPVGTDTADGEISIGADLAGAQDNIIAAINGTDEFNEPHPLVTAGTFASDDLTITALTGGTAGNAIDTTETFTAESNVFGAGHLASGGNCSSANTVTALAAGIESNSYIVSAAAGSGKIDLTAAAKGAGGNAIDLAETLVNGNVNAKTHLENGVDGTLAEAGKVYFDGSFLYVAVDDNTAVDQNWRKVSLGSAY